MNENRSQKLKDIIELLERVRDRELAAGRGPFMSENIFNRIDELYGQLLKELGHDPDNDESSS